MSVINSKLIKLTIIPRVDYNFEEKIKTILNFTVFQLHKNENILFIAKTSIAKIVLLF